MKLTKLWAEEDRFSMELQSFSLLGFIFLVLVWFNFSYFHFNWCFCHLSYKNLLPKWSCVLKSDKIRLKKERKSKFVYMFHYVPFLWWEGARGTVELRKLGNSKREWLEISLKSLEWYLNRKVAWWCQIVMRDQGLTMSYCETLN